MFPVDAQGALLPCGHCTCVQQCFAVAVLDLKAQVSDETAHLLFFKRANMGLDERSSIVFQE